MNDLFYYNNYRYYKIVTMRDEFNQNLFFYRINCMLIRRFGTPNSAELRMYYLITYTFQSFTYCHDYLK